MTKKKWIYAIVALLALVGIFATCVYATPSGKSSVFKSMFKSQKAAKVGAMLGITDEQKYKIQTTLKGYRDEFKPLAEGMIDAQRVLRDAVMSDDFDESAIRKASDDVGEYRMEIAILAGKVYQDVSIILTDEQLGIMDDFKQMRRNHVDDMLELFEKLPVGN